MASGWDECTEGNASYARCADMMTREVLAVCEGAMAAGATEILINDAHGKGGNIDPARLPACARIIRGWSGHPYMMVDGIDGSFDAAFFVGYHAAAGTEGNPLCHTLSASTVLEMRLNGEIASEFTLFSLAAAREKVPVVFLSGDKALIEASAGTHPALVTVVTKEGFGGMTVSRAPAAVLPLLRERAEAALRQDLSCALAELPKRFELQITYKNQPKARQRSYYPGAVMLSPLVVRYASDSYFEILRALQFMVY